MYLINRVDIYCFLENLVLLTTLALFSASIAKRKLSYDSKIFDQFDPGNVAGALIGFEHSLY